MLFSLLFWPLALPIYLRTAKPYSNKRSTLSVVGRLSTILSTIWTNHFGLCYIGNVTVVNLISALQMAIGPSVLVSGASLLILSLTNRLGRVVDRGRSLACELREIPQTTHKSIATQLLIISRRANLLRRAIIFAVLCVLFASTLIITLFFITAMQIGYIWLIVGLFIGALGSLIVSLVAFLLELNQSLIAFHLDISV